MIRAQGIGNRRLTAISHGKLVAVILVALFLNANAEAQQFDYSAVLAGQGKVNGPVNAGGIVWQCNVKYCTTRGPWPVPGVKSCNALATIVGQLASYGYKGHMLSPNDMATCNGKQATTAQGSSAQGTPVNPANPLAALLPGLAGLGTKPPPGALPSSSTPPTPSTRDVGTAGVSFRTVTLSVTGTGVLATTVPFAPVTVHTTAFRVTGTAFYPVTVHTIELRATGTDSD